MSEDVLVVRQKRLRAGTGGSGDRAGSQECDRLENRLHVGGAVRGGELAGLQMTGEQIELAGHDRDRTEQNVNDATRVFHRDDRFLRPEHFLPVRADALMLAWLAPIRSRVEQKRHHVHPPRERGEDVDRLRERGIEREAQPLLHEIRAERFAAGDVDDEAGVEVARATRVHLREQIVRDQLRRFRTLSASTAAQRERREHGVELRAPAEVRDLYRVRIGPRVSEADEENLRVPAAQVLTRQLVEQWQPREDLLGVFAHRSGHVCGQDEDVGGRALEHVQSSRDRESSDDTRRGLSEACPWWRLRGRRRL